MDLALKHYNLLTTDELYDIIALRTAVFVVEQDCPYQDLDGLDKDAYHLIVTENSRTIGTLRILKPGVSYVEAAIGRVASHPEFRDRKLGHLMMEKAMGFIQGELRLNSIRISAQSHLTGYYAQHGFESTGKEYLEDGIPHTEMIYQDIK